MAPQPGREYVVRRPDISGKRGFYLKTKLSGGGGPDEL
jgi:hypothetical protein